MYFKKTILQKVMFAKSYHTINVCMFSSYIRASFIQINVVLVQLASCCCLNSIPYITITIHVFRVRV